MLPGVETKAGIVNVAVCLCITRTGCMYALIGGEKFIVGRKKKGNGFVGSDWGSDVEDKGRRKEEEMSSEQTYL